MFLLKKNFVTRLTSIFIGIISICIILWIQYFKENIPILKISTSERKILSFDYIIVGAGTAGSVVAGILCASKTKNNTILVIEAGDTFGWTTKVPLLATFAQKTDNDWGFKTIPQKYSSKGIMNKEQFLPRGKGLGGSSQLNYLLHFSGNPKDFNNWKENYNLSNWNYESIKPYLDEYPYQEKSKITVPLNIWEIPKNYSVLTETYSNLENEFPNDNLNFHRTQYTIKNGLRSNVYQLYLQPSFTNENLKILTNTVVDRILFKANKASSILFQKYTSNLEIINIKINVKKEIILSAGCYQTPQILQRSGIGPKNYLDKLNIKTIIDQPNIGENLHDHMNLPLYVSIEKEASLTVNKILNPFEIWKYLRTGTGYFSNFGVYGIIDTKNDSYAMTFFGSGSIDEKISLEVSNFQKDAFRSLFPLYNNTSQEGFVVLTTCHQTKSRGTVRIRSRNSLDYPLIDPNYVSADEDIVCMIKSIRTAVKIIKSKSFESLKPKIHWPKLKECKHLGPFKKDFFFNQPNDLYLECLIRHVGLVAHHPGGTCAMGGNNLAPLDDKLRVRGVKGLRVIDASILPTPISGTPNSVLIGLARRGAELVLNEID